MLIKNVSVMRKPSCFDGAGGDDNAKALEALQQQVEANNAELERLRNHNKTLLDEKKTVQGELKTLQASLNGIDVTKVADMLKVFESSEEAKLIAEGKLDEVINKRTEKTLIGFENQIKELNDKLSEKEKSFTELQNKYSGNKINLAIRAAAEKAGVLPSAIDDVIFRSNGIFSLDDKEEIEARTADGNIMKVDGKAMSPELFVKGLQESAPHLWPASESGNLTGKFGKDKGPNPYVKGSNYNLTKQAQISKSDPTLAAELRKEADKINAKAGT